MPRKTAYAKKPITTPGGRIEYLLHYVWQGNQSRMADDLGCSQTLISKVVRGDQAPGPKLLRAAAADPRINADWLVHGVGEPLHRQAPEPVGGDWLAPVAKWILPDKPADYPAAFSGIHVPMPAFFRSPTRYLFQVPDEEWVVGPTATKVKVATGDYLLLEADRGLWCRNPRLLDGKLAGVRITTGEDSTYHLALACWEPRRSELTFDLFNVLEPRAEPECERKHDGILSRGLTLDDSPQEEDQRDRQAELESELEPQVEPHGGLPDPTEEVTKSGEECDRPESQGSDPSTGQRKPALTDVVAFAVLMVRLY